MYFPIARGVFPGINMSVDDDHHYLDGKLEEMISSLSALKHANLKTPPTDLSASLASLKSSLPVWLEKAEAHLRNEETTITVVIRKYVSIERQKEGTRRVYDLTSADDWQIILPYFLRNLPIPMWKVRYLRTFIWV